MEEFIKKIQISSNIKYDFNKPIDISIMENDINDALSKTNPELEVKNMEVTPYNSIIVSLGNKSRCVLTIDIH